MNVELEKYLKSLPRLLVIKTDEEDRLIQEMHKAINKNASLQIFNPAFGMHPSSKYIDEWSALKHPEDKKTMQIHKCLIDIYKRGQGEDESNLYYMLLDADRYLTDAHIIRRLKNIAISASHNEGVLRSVIMVSQSGRVPHQLESFVEVHDYDDPSDDLIRKVLESLEAEVRSFDDSFTLPTDRVGDTIPQEFIDACRGLTVFQLKETIMHFVVADDLSVTIDNMREYRKGIIKKTNLLEIGEYEITFDDIAGLDKLKNRLNKIQTAWTPEGREYGVPVSRGLLQVGVPGCGKSLIAKSLANEMGVTFVKFDPSNLFSSRVGDSEANMRAAIRYIEAVSPCVVFIDEIEKGLAGMQSSSYSDSGTTARVIGTFLSWFQDHNSDIFIIATANDIQSLPPELISRFEEKFFVGMPALEARRDCFEIQFDKYWTDSMGDRDDLDYMAMAEAAGQLTGREIEQVVCDSIRDAFTTEEKKVTTEIVLDVVRTKPPLVQTMEEPITELLEWVGWDEGRQEGIRARYASSEGIVEAELLDEDVVYDATAASGGSRLKNVFNKDKAGEGAN